MEISRNWGWVRPVSLQEKETPRRVLTATTELSSLTKAGELSVDAFTGIAYSITDGIDRFADPIFDLAP